MSEEITDVRPDESNSSGDSEIKRMEEIVEKIIGDKEEANRFEKTMTVLRQKLGILPLESPDYVPTSELEEVIYNMRWNPSYFENCGIYELHEKEMVLCSHILWVKARENRWMSSYKIESKNFEIAMSQAAKMCSGRSIDERRGEALYMSKRLQERSKILEIYRLYADQCEKISDALVQLDNSLKQMINTRRIEFESSRRQN